MLFWDLLVSFLSGLTASLGLGGGFFLIIYLVSIKNAPQSFSQGVNLLFFIPIALISVVVYIKKRLIKGKLILKIFIPGVFGIFLGIYFCRIIPITMLSKIFASFIIFMGIRTIYLNYRKNNKD